MTEQEYSYLKSKIFAITQLDINCYKTEQMRRRLEAFVARYENLTVRAFCEMLEKTPQKQKELLDYLAINVSEFFRDINQFTFLQTRVLPQLMARSRRLNIWSSACSAGQEPYSVAMALEEMCHGSQHRIIATDIDQSALAQASSGGPYLAADVKNVPPAMKFKYLTFKDNNFWVNDAIKKKVNFKRFNLLQDSFETNFDLIICRNVIIYFSDTVREELYNKFYRSLKVGGYLFLGGSEVVLKPAEHGFSMVSPSFYCKVNNGEINNITTPELCEVRQ